MEIRTERNYKVIGLSETNTVKVQFRNGAISDTGMSPVDFGTWGLDPNEVRIVKRGLTKSGRNRRSR